MIFFLTLYILIVKLTSSKLNQRQCKEYSKQITTEVSAIPLIAHPTSQSAIETPKCDYNGVALIVGGKPAQPKEFPYIAAIGVGPTDDIKFICGGTLISHRYVLTASHCLNSKNQIKLVRMGTIDLSSGEGYEDYAIDNIIRHPSYSSASHYYDIGLLRTARRVEFNDFIRPACLYTQPRIDQPTATAAGFGDLEYASIEQNFKLMKVSLDIYNTSVCNNYYKPQSKLSKGLVSHMLCVGQVKGGKDTCQGDSGGPIVLRDNQNQCKHYAIGVTSFGKSCGLVPGVYTKVSEFLDWIENIVWK